MIFFLFEHLGLPTYSVSIEIVFSCCFCFCYLLWWNGRVSKMSRGFSHTVMVAVLLLEQSWLILVVTFLTSCIQYVYSILWLYLAW